MYNDIDIAWLAGILEGEGCFFIQRSTSPYIAVQMADKDIIERVAQIMSFNYSRIRVIKYKDKNKSTMYNLQTGGHDAIKWMKLIRPYMGIRRGNKIDEIIKTVLESRPFMELGKDYCVRGHSIKYLHESYIEPNGARHCKICAGVKVRAPKGWINPEIGLIPVINPFEKVQ